MSRESTDSEGLTDWALVSEEGNLEAEGSRSSGGSSDGFVRVNRDGVVYNRSSSEEASLPESEASPDMSDLLTSSLEEVESQGQDVAQEPKELQSSTLSDPQAVSSLAGSIASTGGESAELITDDEEHIESALVVDLPSSIDITSSVSSLSLVPGLPQASDVDLVDADAVEYADDDGLISLSTESLTCSKSDAEGNGAMSVEVIGALGNADGGPVPIEVPVAKEIAGEEVGKKTEAGVASPGTQWLKYPLENSTEMHQTLRLGDGRVIVAPPGADMESFAASLNLTDKSETSSDTGSDSDFVRLDAASSSSSSTENSDSDGEEVLQGELPAPDQEEDNEMSASVSSVSSRFRFLPQHSSEGDGSQDQVPDEDEAAKPSPQVLLNEPIPLPEPHSSLQPQDSTEPQAPVQPPDSVEGQEQVPIEANVQPKAAEFEANVHPEAPDFEANVQQGGEFEDQIRDQQEIGPQDLVVPQAQVNLHALPQVAQLNLDPPQDPLLPVLLDQEGEPEAPSDDINDGDTESMSGHSEDERTESEQSEAQQGQEAEEEDGLLDDITDIPLVQGRRQYVHRQNKRLNWTLDVVVTMNVLLVIGIGIGHFIGSMHEQYMNTEVRQAQQSELSLLQDDLLQCHQKTDQILQRSEQLLKSELEQRQEVLEALSSSNTELKEQVKTQEAQTQALGQCRQAEKRLENLGTDLRNEVNRLRHENEELSSRISALQYQTVLPQDDTKTVENSKLIQRLTLEVDMLKHENEDLKEEIARLKLLLKDQFSDYVTVEEEDEGYESLDEVTEVTSTSCPKVEGRGKVMDLKAKINLLEQENADMRAEIGRLRYKSHPGNSQVHRLKEGQEDLEEDVLTIDVEYPDSPREYEAESLNKLKEELDAAKKQAENWEHLYLNLKERENGQKERRCNSSVDFFTCMGIFTKRLNSSINATVIKDFLNITRLLLSVEDVKDAFVKEFQNIWQEFSGSGREKNEKNYRDGSQKKWSDSVKNILNKTQSSMSDVSQQIKQTWNQVKNLSGELWKRHEPSLSKVANKITERVKSFGDHLHTKIHQKANKWFRKDKNRDRHQWAQEKPKHQKKFSERSHKKEHKEWKKQQEEEKHQEKMRKKEQNKVDKLKKRINKHFQNMKKLIGEMSEAKHLTMTEKDVEDVTVFFSNFQAEWNIHKWLTSQDVQWTLCQAAWWNRRLQNEAPTLGLKCFDAIYAWQLKWAPNEKGNFHGKRDKGYQLGKKLKNKILEKNHAEGKPYSYEDEKLKDKDSDLTGWYEQGTKDREDIRKGKEDKLVRERKDWYNSRMKSRVQQREEEHRADWLFDRAMDREESRSSVLKEDSQKGTDWLFARAEDREFHHSRPDTWYFKRSEVREEKREKTTAYQQPHNHVDDVDDVDDDDVDAIDDDAYDDYYDENGFLDLERMAREDGVSCIDW